MKLVSYIWRRGSFTSDFFDDFYYYHTLRHVISNPKQLSISALIVQLMNSTDYYVNMQLVQFISSCFEMRDKLLSNS